MQSSLGGGYPPFVLWRFSELPAEWLRSPSQDDLARASNAMQIPPGDLECYTAVELPDIGVGRIYYIWAVDQLERATAEDDFVPVMLVSQGDFRGEGQDKGMEATVQFVCSLCKWGKPPPLFTKVFGYRN